MNYESHLPIEYIHTLLSKAEAQGCDIPALLEEFDIHPDTLENQSSFSALKYGQLYQRIMWLTQDECFGMLTGGKLRWGAFRLMCLTLIPCNDLRQALLRSGEFAEICRGFLIRSNLYDDNSDVVSVRMGPIEQVSNDDFSALMSAENADGIRTSLAVWHRFHCWLIGEEIPLLSISFSFPCPDSMKYLVESYPAMVKFEQDYNGFEFDRGYLDHRIIQNPQTLDDFLRLAPYHLVISDSARSTLKSKVRGILSRDVSGSMKGAEAVASQLNLSVTTLRRHLQQEGTSFQKLKDECRLEAAVHYLGCPDLTNAVISERLGFDETSTFFRAFKKWTGLTPGEYRKQLPTPSR